MKQDATPKPWPHDDAAEQAVIAAVTLDREAFGKLGELRPIDFHAGPHQHLFRACVALHEKGDPIDPRTVAAWLKDRGLLEVAGGAGFLAEVLDASPAPANVAAHAGIVRELARRREILRRAERILREGENGADASTLAASAAEIVQVAGASGREKPWFVLENARELAEPLEPIRWLCQPLRIARESVIIVGGYGYSRKTLFAQSLALSIASGRPVFQLFRTTRATVVHVDYEQGKRTTRGRYQRMARALGVELESASLHVVTFPRLRLNSPGARGEWRRLLEESCAGLIIIDSLRAAVSDVDENSSEIREHIDMIGQECKQVGAAVLIIHHAKKPDKPRGEGAGSSGEKYSLRGSGAIFDAVDEHFALRGEKDSHTVVSHEKERLEGNAIDDFGLDTEDVRGPDGDARWGLRIVHLDVEQIAQRCAIERQRIEARRRQRADERAGGAAPSSSEPPSVRRWPVPPDLG